MTLSRIFFIKPTPKFESELKNIIYYIREKLQKPETARNLYKKVQKEINSLKYFPERYMQVPSKNRKLRRMIVDNYIIIYEVKRDSRTSIYFTYISW